MDKPYRKQIRLPNYDYSQAGAYFVTICTQNKVHLFGEIVGAGSKPARVPGPLTEILETIWSDLQNHNLGIRVDKFVVMPNHIHGIILINELRGAGLEPAPTKALRAGYEPAPTKALPEIVRQFKTFSSRRINEFLKTPGRSVWQRGYYEHIIRNEQDYLDIWQYIENNPDKWVEDKYYHTGARKDSLSESL